MQTQIEKQSMSSSPAASQAVFAQGQGESSPEANVKRCGYCDRLVRWTLVEGKNVAVNCDGSRHQCLTDGTAKRRSEPIRHAKPSHDEVAEFLALPSQQESSRQKAQSGEDIANPERTRDSEIRAMHDANISTWKAQTEAMVRLAHAMLKVAQSNNALAESNNRLSKTYSRFAHVMERAGYTVR
jgi:hypothetical protein